MVAPVLRKDSSNVRDHVGQIKGPGVRNQVVPGLSWDTLGALRCVANLYATNTAVQVLLSYSTSKGVPGAASRPSGSCWIDANKPTTTLNNAIRLLYGGTVL
eukprot:328297-Pleurochrysis_carterae.AAC.1